MSDRIPGPPKTVQQSHTLRTVRRVNLNEQRADEKRRLAELEERMCKPGCRKFAKGSGRVRKQSDEPDSPTEESLPSEPRARNTDRHIDFTA